MIRFLLPVVVIGVVLASIYSIIHFSKTKSSASLNPSETLTATLTKDNASGPKEVPKTLPLESGSPITSTDSAVLTKINDLAKKIGNIQALEDRVKTVEKTTDDLKNRIVTLENSPAPNTTYSTSTSTVSKATQYIYAIGYGGSTTQNDWVEISTIKITIDPSLYPGFSSMNLEGLVRVKDGNGKVFARLYSDGTSIAESELSTDSYQNIWVSGSNFTTSSKKTYTIQLKSLTGYEAFISDARIKVNF